MLKGLNKDNMLVLYQINNLSEIGLNFFKLDNENYSLFPNEQEVLLATGLYF